MFYQRKRSLLFSFRSFIQHQQSSLHPNLLAAHYSLASEVIVNDFLYQYLSYKLFGIVCGQDEETIAIHSK
jgi:hypothetical protein